MSSSAQLDANLLEETGDLKGGGDVGESVYGEKADMRPVFGDGIRGDFKAIIVVRVARGTSMSQTVCKVGNEQTQRVVEEGG